MSKSYSRFSECFSFGPSEFLIRGQKKALIPDLYIAIMPLMSINNDICKLSH